MVEDLARVIAFVAGAVDGEEAWAETFDMTEREALLMMERVFAVLSILRERQSKVTPNVRGPRV
jgi:hypothetical protein